MTLEDYRDAWSRDEAAAGDGPDAERLLDRVRERSEAFESRVRRRDRRETLAACAVALLFGWELFTAASRLEGAGALVIVVSAVFVVWWLRRARRAGRADRADRPVAEQLHTHLARVEEQIRLQETVLWWYLAPPGAGVVLYVLGLDAGTRATALVGAALVVVYGGIWRMNQRIVRRDLEPRRRELERTLERLEG
jgi:Flp pilus assembly protein TadB